MTIKAIETAYAGYRFRSRLEARWAVAFTNTDLISRWEYEPQGFDLDGTPYLPDFRVWWSSQDYSWVEIKPDNFQPTDRDDRSYLAMARETTGGFYLLRGIGIGYRHYNHAGFRDVTEPFTDASAIVAGRSARFEHGERGR